MSKLRINYRTTEEIRDWAVSVLTGQPIDDLDGGLDDHLGYKSLLHGAPPTVRHLNSEADEQTFVIGVVGSPIVEDNVSAETTCVMLIVGVNEGVIPSPRVSEDRVVQKRCLLHVAASRARDTLTIASWGRASRFVVEFEGDGYEV